MRRPISFISASFALGIFFQYHLKLNFIFISAALIAGIFVSVHFIKTRKSTAINFDPLYIRIPAIIILIILFFIIGLFRMSISEYNFSNDSVPSRSQFSFKCKISEITDKHNGCLMIEAEHDRKTYLIKAYGSDKHKDYSYLIGKSVYMRANKAKYIFPRNPGDFDYSLHLKSKGIYALLETDFETLKYKNSELKITDRICILRHHITSAILKSAPKEQAALITGLISGDKSYMSEKVYDSFRKNGLVHILSVSGLHIGILYAFLLKLFGGRKNKFFFISAAVILVIYSAFCSFSPSVVRAVIMIFIHIIASLLHRPYDMLSAGSFVFITMLLYRPFYLFNMGFQLSFLGIFSIAVSVPFFLHIFYGHIKKFEPSFSRILFTYFITNIAVQIGLAPYIAYNFCYFSFMSVILNPIAVAVIGILLPLSLSLTVLYPISYTAFRFCLDIATPISDILITLSEKASDIFHSDTDIPSPGLIFLLFYYCSVLIITSENMRMLFHRKSVRTAAAPIFIIFATAIITYNVSGDMRGKCDLMFIDVGQGDCVVIKTPENKTVIYDGGGKFKKNIASKILKPVLLKNGIRKIDLAIVSHMHEDHYGGIRDLTKIFKVEKVGFYEGNKYRENKLLKDMAVSKKDIIYLKSGDKINIENGISMEFIYPFKQPDSEYKRFAAEKIDENSISLVCIFNYNGIKIAITGDIGVKQEKEILDYRIIPKCDILKVCHHGSKYSSSPEFIKHISPKLAVIQCGKNLYGHPSADLIKRMKKLGINVKRNDKDGAIIIENLNDNNPEIHTMRELSGETAQ